MIIKNKFHMIILIIICLGIGIIFIANSYSLKKGDKYFDNGEYNKALQIYNKHKNLNEDNLIKKAKCDINIGNYDEALISLNLAEDKLANQKENEKLATVYSNKIVCFYQKCNYADVITTSNMYFNIETNPYLNMSVENMSINSYIKLNKFDECIEAIKTFIPKYSENQFKPHLIELNDMLFSSYFMKGDYNNALKTNDILLKYDPDNIQFYIGRSVVFSKIYGKQYAFNYLNSLKSQFKNNSTLENFINSYK